MSVLHLVVAVAIAISVKVLLLLLHQEFLAANYELIQLPKPGCSASLSPLISCAPLHPMMILKMECSTSVAFLPAWQAFFRHISNSFI